VLVSGTGLEDLLQALRAAGYAPVQEGSGGAVVEGGVVVEGGAAVKDGAAVKSDAAVRGGGRRRPGSRSRQDPSAGDPAEPSYGRSPATTPPRPTQVTGPEREALVQRLLQASPEQPYPIDVGATMIDMRSWQEQRRAR